MTKTSLRIGRRACAIVLLAAMLTLGACATRSKITASCSRPGAEALALVHTAIRIERSARVRCT